MKNKIKKFMDEPLTIRRELKISLIATGIFAIPYAILIIYGILKENEARQELEKREAERTRLKEMMANIHLGKTKK